MAVGNGLGTDSELITGLQAISSNQNIEVADIEDLSYGVNEGPFQAIPQDSSSIRGTTNERRLARVVDEQQVTVEVQMAVLAGLNRGIGRLIGRSARWEGQLRKNRKGRERHARQALRGEFGRIDYDLLNIRMGWLLPVGGEGCHRKVCWGVK